MNAVTIIGGYLFWSTVAGSLGAAAMVLVLWGFTQSGLAKVRLLIALGSLVTRSYEKAILVGGFVHAVAGVFFGLCYTFIMVAVGHPGIGSNMLLGAVIGMLHGLVMALVLVSTVAEVHPLPEFQQRGYVIALSHWVGHVVYGLTVGFVIGMSGLIGTV
jgi:hypothetical protein